MGIIQKGILGNFRKSVGIITGRISYNQGIISSRNYSAGKTNSEAQLAQRAKIKQLTTILSGFYQNEAIKWIIPGKKNEMKWNICQAINQDAFTSEGLEFPENLKMSNGRLSGLVITQNRMRANYDTGRIDWNSIADGKPSSDYDVLHVVLYNQTRAIFFYTGLTRYRYIGYANYYIPSDWAIGEIVTALACFSETFTGGDTSLTFSRTDEVVS